MRVMPPHLILFESEIPLMLDFAHVDALIVFHRWWKASEATASIAVSVDTEGNEDRDVVAEPPRGRKRGELRQLAPMRHVVDSRTASSRSTRPSW